MAINQHTPNVTIGDILSVAKSIIWKGVAEHRHRSRANLEPVITMDNMTLKHDQTRC